MSLSKTDGLGIESVFLFPLASVLFWGILGRGGRGVVGGIVELD